jgi:hypothetical protein
VLPPSDHAYLAERQIAHEVLVDATMICIVFREWDLPFGYDRGTADLLLRLQQGYPDIPPDMWWLYPAVRLADGGVVQATESMEQHLGRPWQRWSRHFAPGQWRSGIDGLESFLALIRGELIRSAARAA